MTATETSIPKFLTVADVVAALGGPTVVSERTVQRMARRGEIPGAKWIARKWFFQREPVCAWIEGVAGGATVLPMHARRSG